MWRTLILGLWALLPPVAHAQEQWYRGNVHVHTTRSDGTSPPAEVVEWYQSRGYSFLVLTDHDLQSVTPALLEQFNAPGSFLLIPGVEVTDRVGTRPVHLNGLGVDQVVTPQGGPDVATVIARNRTAIEQAGGIAVLNHPNGLLSAALQTEEIAASGVGLFEVCCADYLGGSGHPSTEQIWDQLLTSGRLILGIAADDAHDFGPGSRDPGSAWIMVHATELTQRAILKAIQRGDFYSTTGVRLTQVRRFSDGLCLDIAEYDSYGFRTTFIGPGGGVLHSDETREPCFRPRELPSYLRARVQRSDGALAWVQPIALGKPR